MPLRVADPAVTVTGLPRLAPSTPNCTWPVIDPAYVEVTVAVKVTPWPDIEGFGEEVTPVVVLDLMTTCPQARRPVLGLKLDTPRKVAVSVCVPRASALVVTDATPWPSRLCGPPMGVLSATNWTVPVGVPAPGAVAVTAAMNCTPCPKAEGLMSALTLVDVPAWLTTWPVEPWLALKSLVPHPGPKGSPEPQVKPEVGTPKVS